MRKNDLSQQTPSENPDVLIQFTEKQLSLETDRITRGPGTELSMPTLQSHGFISITNNPTLYPDTSHLIGTPKESAPQFPRVSKKTYIKSQKLRPSSAARHAPLTCHIRNDKGSGSCASETGDRGHLCGPYCVSKS